MRIPWGEILASVLVAGTVAVVAYVTAALVWEMVR